MALENFNNLKEKKKISVLEAISHSLIHNTYDELSINDIAVEADISRGSFYNYFVDKNDAVRTLIVSKLELLKKTFMNTIVENDGQLFVGAKKTYDLIQDTLKNKIYLAIMKNITYFIDFITEIVYSKGYADEFEELLEWLVNNTKEGKTVIKTKKEMANVIEMLIGLYANSTMRIVTEVEMNRKYDDFDYKLQIIEKGVQKEK